MVQHKTTVNVQNWPNITFWLASPLKILVEAWISKKMFELYLASTVTIAWFLFSLSSSCPVRFKYLEAKKSNSITSMELIMAYYGEKIEIAFTVKFSFIHHIVQEFRRLSSGKLISSLLSSLFLKFCLIVGFPRVFFTSRLFKHL